jgi:N-acetylglutamate synthase-like GNAT family acetyltransferase
MNSGNYRVRRATLDDIGQLTALWEAMHFAAADMAKRTTEFQVAENAEGKLVAAVGLQMAQKQGLIHSEGFLDFSIADQVRPLLWERMQSVATNHGLLRLWTQEQAPFWKQSGLAKADDAALEKLPTSWRGQSPEWLTLKLREDIEAAISVDKEFALFMESEKQRTERAFHHARILKMVATVIAVILLLLVIAGAVYLFGKNPHLLRR